MDSSQLTTSYMPRSLASFSWARATASLKHTLGTLIMATIGLLDILFVLSNTVIYIRDIVRTFRERCT
jgi:hypothetical protein